MSKTIWKFELETVDAQEINVPEGSKILTVQTQNGIPCIWALVDPEAKKESMRLEVFGTGHDISNSMVIERKYIGTYQLMGGSLVFHVFERVN